MLWPLVIILMFKQEKNYVIMIIAVLLRMRRYTSISVAIIIKYKKVNMGKKIIN